MDIRKEYMLGAEIDVFNRAKGSKKLVSACVCI
jgi:hypothetical protein